VSRVLPPIQPGSTRQVSCSPVLFLVLAAAWIVAPGTRPARAGAAMLCRASVPSPDARTLCYACEIPQIGEPARIQFSSHLPRPPAPRAPKNPRKHAFAAGAGHATRAEAAAGSHLFRWAGPQVSCHAAGLFLASRRSKLPVQLVVTGDTRSLTALKQNAPATSLQLHPTMSTHP
jgi:hypothetical protein